MKRSFWQNGNGVGDRLFDDSFAEYYAANPAVALRDSCVVYGKSDVSTADIAPIIGANTKQYHEIAHNFHSDSNMEISPELLSVSDINEVFIMQYLPKRVSSILEQLLGQEIFIPRRQRFISSLWEDLKLLRFLHLVEERDNGNLLHYSLNLSQIKWFR